MKLIYSPEAIEDLVRHRTFISKWNPAAAARIAKELVARIKNIREFPEMGVAVQQADDPEALRDAIFGKYIVRYVVHANVVAVLRIWHHLEDRKTDS
jgi:plasmid stabilization system protein ParE